MWGVMVAGLCVLWFTTSAGAIPLESWDDKIPSATLRFKVLSEFGGAAVLDKETGLVWEKSPDTTDFTWSGARFACINKNVGGRKGWRLPSIPELASLIDQSVVSPPKLPLGHPFLVDSTVYWSASTTAENTTIAWDVFLFNGDVLNHLKTDPFERAWCVRGGMNADAY
jgi:hypothetical protein